VFDLLNNFFTGFGQVILVFTVAIALLQCFFGYRLLKAWVAIIGFLVGFVIGFGVAMYNIGGEAYLPAVIGIVAGILLALVAFKLYLVGVFIYCGAIAFSAVQTIPFPENQTWDIVLIVLGVIAFLVAGILAVRFSRPCIIAVTAISGAFNAVDALKTPVAALGENEGLKILAGVALAALGIVIQFLTTKKSAGH
jgi:hypothetical protein